MPPKEIHEYFMETIGKVSSSCNTVKNGQQRLRGGESALRMMDSLAAPKMPPLIEMSRSLYDKRRDQVRSTNSFYQNMVNLLDVPLFRL